VSTRFEKIFGTPAEHAASAPGRVNVLGDHTDYNQGFVLPCAIPQRTMVEIARGTGAHEVYSETLRYKVSFESAGALSDFARYVGGCIAVLEERGVPVPPLRLRIVSEVPVGAGLSSSAALEVATLRAIDGLLGLGLTAMEIAMLAWQAENRFAGVACGIMDQMASSLGRTDRMLFLDARSLDYSLVPLPAHTELLVVDSGAPRTLAASAYNQRRAECQAAAEMLGVASLREVTSVAATEALPSPLRERARHVVSEDARVLRAVTAPAAEFGALMNLSHESLRDDFDVSVPAVDELVSHLQRDPAVFGARITGAGFGGACVALVRAGASAPIPLAADAFRLARPRRIVPPLPADGKLL
jgi:galactokinase